MDRWTHCSLGDSTNLMEAIHADEICYFESGQVIRRGTHNELMTIDGRYAHLFRLQSQDHALANVYCNAVAG